MIIKIGNKDINVTQEEYEALIASQTECCPGHCPEPHQLNKMNKLIDAVESIKDAIEGIQLPIRYSLQKTGSTISLVGSDNTVTSVEDKDDDTKYNISIEDRTISVRGTDNSVQSIELPEDKDTKYDISFDSDQDKINLDSTDGVHDSIDVSKFANDSDIDNIYNNAATEEEINTLFPSNP